MSIDFVAKDAVRNPRVTPSIKFEDSFDEWKDATIYIDNVPVAYFDAETGGIRALLLEVGPYTRGDDSEKVKYLTNRGFKLKEIPASRGLPYVNFTIMLHEAE